MERAILVLVLAAFVCGAVFPESGKNLQKIYPIDSDIYQAIIALYVSQGLALPSTTGPWSADELLKKCSTKSTRASSRTALWQPISTHHLN